MKDKFEKKDSKTFVNIFTALAVGVGLILIGGMFDGGDKESREVTEAAAEAEQQESSYKEELESQLEKILGSAEGVGRIRVMITLENEGESRLAEDVSRERSSTEGGAESEKEEYKTLLTEGNRPYIINRSSPKVEGVLITCDGGGSAEVKSSLISACCALFGIDANKIEVLKMGGN